MSSNIFDLKYGQIITSLPLALGRTLFENVLKSRGLENIFFWQQLTIQKWVSWCCAAKTQSKACTVQSSRKLRKKRLKSNSSTIVTVSGFSRLGYTVFWTTIALGAPGNAIISFILEVAAMWRFSFISWIVGVINYSPIFRSKFKFCISFEGMNPRENCLLSTCRR